MKGVAAAEQVKKEFGKYMDEVYYMPIIRLENKKNPSKLVNRYLEVLSPPAFEFTIGKTEPEYTQAFKSLRTKGTRVWVNSLWAYHNAGHKDNKAVLNLSVYDWFLEKGINMIQTDRPHLLLKYLRSKGLHD